MADSVVDEFAICDFGDEADVSRPAFDAWILERFRDGRYYKGDDGAFLSAPLLAQGGGRPIHLLSVSWTARLPSDSRTETHVEITGDDEAPQPVIPRLQDPRLANVGIEMDLLGADGTLRSDPIQVLTAAGGTAVRRMLPGLRYRARFRTGPLLDPLTGLPDPDGQPVLETPFLDDVTFSWQEASGPRVLAWDR